MAAKTYYAWSPIHGRDKEEKLVIVKRGAKVTASDLGIPAVEFEAMIRDGAVRNKPFPAPDDYEGSAIDWHRDQIAEAANPLEEVEAEAELEEVESKS